MQTTLEPDTWSPVAGVDEAGRGPLAGPVVAAAVILAPGQDSTEFRDSKTLDGSTRERLARQIMDEARAWSIAWADRAEIDALNILQATMLAMRRAIIGLAVRPSAVRIDGNRLPDLDFGRYRLAGEAVVRGDGLLPVISAASILAKTARDRIMEQMDLVYPEYRFAQHKGYGTALHRECLRRHGPSAIHRRSFSPVRLAS